ncbi:MAG: hypothetical protein ACM31E_06445 [Fibrobacterota bacterium]|jgi:hypothetical protein|nr:hypothetical protein [Chitinispirillaceae bacterium]
MKVPKIIMLVSSLVTGAGAIAIPIALPLTGNADAYQFGGMITSLVLFLAGFVLTVSMGWIKRVKR